MAVAEPAAPQQAGCEAVGHEVEVEPALPQQRGHEVVEAEEPALPQQAGKEERV